MSDISLEGYQTLVKQFDRIASAPDDKQVENRLILIARYLRKIIRRNAPRGKKSSGDFRKSVGRLRRSIQARRFRNKVKNSPSVYVRVNRKIAPHAHLVEHGNEYFRFPSNEHTFVRGSRKGSTRSAKKALHFYINGEEVFAKWVGPMPAKPFFRPTVDMERHNIENKIQNAISDYLFKIYSERK